MYHDVEDFLISIEKNRLQDIVHRFRRRDALHRQQSRLVCGFFFLV